MNNYELMLVLDSQAQEDQIDKTIAKTRAFLEARGAEIVNVERWGMRRLAYDIKKRQQGYYVLIQFRSKGGVIRELDQACRLDETIIRYMVVACNRFYARQELARQEAAEVRTTASQAPPEEAVASSPEDEIDAVAEEEFEAKEEI